MALIHITSFCNQKCVFCSAYFTPSEKDEVPENWVKLALKEKSKLIQISGGEPFLSDIDEFIKFAYFLKKRDKQVEVQTNATLIEDIDKNKLKMLVTLINSTGGYFNINFSAHNSKIDYKVTGLKNAFKKREKGILILKNLNAKIRLTYVINSINYKYLPDFSKLIVKKYNFIDWVQFSFVKGIGKAKDNKAIIPQYSKVSPFLIKAFEILEKNKIRFEVDHIPLCFLGKYWRYNVDVNKILRKEKGYYLIEKKKLKQCKGCHLYEFCSGPRIDYIEIYKKL